jgi:hypothetical protein
LLVVAYDGLLCLLITNNQKTMNTYTIYFFYGTDCRCDWTGEAHDEVRALAAAMDHHKLEAWITNGNQFTIEISRA